VRRVWQRIVARLRRDFVAGLLVIVPVGFTILAIFWIVGQLDNLVLPKVFRGLGMEPRQPPFVGVVVTLGLILAGGAVARSFVGRAALRYWERLVDRIPVARSLYAVLKQFMEAVFGTGTNEQFRSVVLIEYPRRGVWSYAFLTGRIAGSAVPGAGHAELPEQMVKVFIPSTPNPTTGYFLLLPEEDIIETGLSVEEAFKLIISAGIATGETETWVRKPEPPIS
jgi:uncharacterized membrane protein